MKIKAYQIPPEHQVSPLIQFDEIPENVSIYGNPRYNERKTDLFSNLPGILDDLAEELFYLMQGQKQYTDFSTILEAITGRDDYTRPERKKWVELLRRWTETDEETGVFLDALHLITKKEYAHTTLWGSCQGDWQNIIYPIEYGADFPRFFQIEYFNLGTEWQVKEDDGEEWSIYCLEDPRAEIADATGADPGDIILHVFDGWKQTPRYKVVEA